MTQQEHFDRSVAVLTKAYFDNTLVKGNCHACAVGNLVCAANNWSYAGKGIDLRAVEAAAHRWYGLLEMNQDSFDSDWPTKMCEDDVIEAQKQIASTGYTYEQIIKIEHAFEGHTAGNSPEQQYLGLMAVVDVLADIHGIDLSGADAAKALFVKPALA